MRRNRILASLVTVGLAALSIGTATAWFSDSATISFEISAADNFDGDDGGKVWVCKLIGPPENPSVKPGKNPIHVSIDSLDAEEGFADAHPSYVVDHGDVVCVVPGLAPIEAPGEVPISPAPRAIETQPEETTPPDPTTTTSTAAETTTSTNAPSTTTTTTSEPTSTTSPPPEDSTTTTPGDPDIDP